ncbi:hypothetical protein ACHHYP_03824 [Achlya hypogyna]|uniref:RING-type domain-containing protein n=1 Tax=Achlya hypogyna TaxID=1202772 RepID=A0A1V9Z2V4_ACHHY|nr:hypothetical protein ACHHYP_03824 [Achlya hypogyna]
MDRPRAPSADFEADLMDMDQNEVAYLGPPVIIQPTLQTLRKQDETQFVLQYREAKEMRPDVVAAVRTTANERRRRPLEQRDGGVFAALFTSLAPTEKHPYAQHADEVFLDMLSTPSTPPGPSTRRGSISPPTRENRVREHLQTLFQTLPGQRSLLVKPVQHSLCSILFEFAQIFHALYGAESPDVTTVGHASRDVVEFGQVLLQVLVFKYPPLRHNTASLDVATDVVEEALFVHLQPTLHGIFAATYSAADDALWRKLERLRSMPIGRFGVVPTFAVPCYDDAVVTLDALASARTPTSKVLVLAATCRAIDGCIKAHYAGTTSTAESNISITSDELPAVLAFVVARTATITRRLASYVALMDAFLPSRFATGEEAFGLASLHAAIAWFVSLKDLEQEALKHVALTAHVSRVSLRGTAAYTCYHYTISSPTTRWTIDRRYSECHRFKTTLLRAMRRVPANLAVHLAPLMALDFPKKHLFADHAKRIVVERKLKLKLFLYSCLEVRSNLYLHAVIYEQNADLVLKSRCVELIELLDAFLEIPPVAKEDQRKKSTTLLMLLQQDPRASSMSSWRPSFLDDGDCSICLCDLELDDGNAVTLRCGHVFHRECVLPWLARDYSCPLCRGSLH